MTTALFFGSFNPIHIGHLALAQYVLNFGDVDKVLLVVSPQNPFKEQRDLAPARDRLRMAQLATEHDERIIVTDVELSLPQPSYTINTIDALEGRHKGEKFAIIIGGDNLAGLPRWREASRLVKGRHFIVYPRRGYECPADTVLSMGGSVDILQAPQMDISSTLIRQWIAAGKDVRHFVPNEALTLAGTLYR